ncbi:MAG: DUF5652 family protein [Candidatus Saccharimonadales bacterium]
MQTYWWIISLLVIWELIWKAWALWLSARNNDKAWFIVLFLINSLGILPIFYVFVFSRRNSGGE